MPGAGEIGSLVCFALCAFFVGSAGALAEKHEGVSRGARDTAPETVGSASSRWGEDEDEGTFFLA